jgi:peptide/nickel transport system substrate-binding protein
VRLKTGALVAGSAAFALVLSACGGGGGGTSNNQTNGPKGASGFNAGTTGVVNPSDKKGGTLKLANSDDIDSYDPARTYYAWGFNFTKSFYVRTLVTTAPKVGKEGTVLVPDLAQAMPEISADKLTYTFKLKSGLKFEDGTPITSKDVKYGIERVFAQDVLSGGPTYLVDFLDQGQNYPGPYKDTDPEKLGLKSVTTPDDSTIVFKLKDVFADFPYLVSMPGAGPVPRAKDTGERYANKPVSSGPYKFQSLEVGKKVVLVRNENWDPATDPNRKALPDEVDMTLKLDANEIDNELLDGTLDVDTAQVGVQQAAQAKILLNPDLKKNADEGLTGFTRYFAIGTKVPPFDNIHCRNAVEYATDKVALQTARGGADAGGDIATSLLPPNILGHDDAIDPFNTKSGKPQVDKAKDELKQCGHPDGFTTTIATTNTGKGPKTAEAVQQALAQVGIKVTIAASDASGYYRTTIGSPSNVKAKGYGLMIAGWGADFPTAYGFLQVLLDGRAIKPSGNNNYAELNDPEINSLIDQAKAETDVNKAAAIWTQIDKKAMEQAVNVPFVWDKALNYRNPRLTNAFVNGSYGQLDFGSLGVVS